MQFLFGAFLNWCDLGIPRKIQFVVSAVRVIHLADVASGIVLFPSFTMRFFLNITQYVRRSWRSYLFLLPFLLLRLDRNYGSDILL